MFEAQQHISSHFIIVEYRSLRIWVEEGDEMCVKDRMEENGAILDFYYILRITSKNYLLKIYNNI